jgi:hypothetical protein
MVSTFTTNKSFEKPGHGDQVNTWDATVNSNMNIMDNSLGTVTTIALTNSPVTLSSAQYQCAFIKLTGALSANVALTFPSGIGSFYTMINATTGSSSFIVTMTTTAAGTVIGLPPGVNTKVLIDGTNPQYAALPHHIGEYWLHAGSSVPLWVTQCTVPPYLNCDGTGFSSGTYPHLFNSFGGSATLPDMRGRGMFALDQGTGRNGLAVYAGTGSNTYNITLGASNIPAHNHPVIDPSHLHGAISGGNFVTQSTTGTNANLSGPGGVDQLSSTTGGATTGLTVSNSTYPGAAVQGSQMPPAIAHGITMVRAGG